MAGSTPPPAPNRPKWPRRLLDGLARRLVLTTASATLLSYFARLHWALDNLTAFVIQYAAGAVVALVLLFALRRWRWALAAAAVLAVNLFRLAPADRGPSDTDSQPLRLVTANVNFANARYEPLLKFVRDANPDLIIIPELSPRSAEALDGLKGRWPHSVVVARDDPFGIGLYSKLAFDDSRVVEAAETGFASIVVRVTHEGTRLTVIGTHPPPPNSARAAEYRNRQFSELVRLARDAEGEVLLAGDLNVSPWSPHFKDLFRGGGLRDSRFRLDPQATWPARYPPLMKAPIDHVLMSDGLVIEERHVGPPIGSDHLPVLVRLSLGTAP